MKPFFSKKDNRVKFKKIIDSWIGTPYRHFTHVKQRGTDCVLFIGNAFMEMRVLTELKYDYYSKDWYMHGDRQIVLDNFKKHVEDYLRDDLIVKEINIDESFMFADWVIFSTHKKGIPNHASLYYNNGRIIECVAHVGVVVNPLRKNLKKIYRLFYK